MTFDPKQPWASPSTPAGSPAINPYAPPSADVTPAMGGIDDAESIRRQFLNHEASIRSIGFFFLLGFYSMIPAFVVIPFMLFSSETMGFGFVMMAFAGVIGLLYYYLGTGLRRLDPKVRLGVTIFAIIGLLGFPFGTLISGYILYLLHGEKGQRVMTREYQQVVAATPHIKYRTPLWVWLLLLAVLAFFVIGIAFSV